MKTLQEIKNEYAREIKFNDWEDLYRCSGYYDEDIFFMHENKVFELVQQEQQKVIAENAKIDNLTSESKYDVIVDKKSIINENNIIR